MHTPVTTRARSAWAMAAKWAPVALVDMALALVAAARSLGQANADMLLGPIMSTERLTFYYWQQDRLANVIPALAWPVHDIVANFYLQAALLGFAHFALISLLVALHQRARGSHSVAVTAWATALAGATMVLLVFDSETIYELVFEQHFALSWLLVVGGCALMFTGIARSARGTGFVLVLVAAVVNPSVALALPVAMLVSFAYHGRRRWGLVAGAFGYGYVLSASAARAFGVDHERLSASYTTLSLDEFGDHVATAWGNIVDSMAVVPALAIVGTGVALLISQRHSTPRWLVLLHIGAGVLCVGWVLLFSNIKWVLGNDLGYRYFHVVHLSVVLAAAGVSAAAAQRVLDRVGDREVPARRAIAALALVAALVVAPLVPGHREIDAIAEVGPSVEIAERDGIVLIVGSYWRAWPTVFALEAQGRDAFGIADRGTTMLTDVLAAVAEIERSGAPVRLLCVDDDIMECDLKFSEFVGSSCATPAALRDGPVVIEVARADGS